MKISVRITFKVELYFTTENSLVKGLLLFFLNCSVGAFLADPRALQCKSNLSANSFSPLIKKINKKERKKKRLILRVSKYCTYCSWWLLLLLLHHRPKTPEYHQGEGELDLHSLVWKDLVFPTDLSLTNNKPVIDFCQAAILQKMGDHHATQLELQQWQVPLLKWHI